MYEDHRIEVAARNGRIFYPTTATSRLVNIVTKNISIDAKSIPEKVLTAPGTTMECIAKYSGTGGGLTERQFKQDAKAFYNAMLRDPQQHLITDFGQWEFIGLMGSRLTGEARTVHASFLERWDLDDPNNPIFLDAEDVERRRQLWRLYRRENAAYTTMRAMSSIAAPPPGPAEPEPRDLERFFADLEARFRSSAVENLAAI